MRRPADPSSGAAPRRAAAGRTPSAAVALLAASLVAMAGSGRAATAAAHGAAATSATRTPDATSPRSSTTGQDADAGSRSVAARARMNECGHQWNNMKRAGTASGTWKEFSRNCLAQK